eukprot:6482664-Prymnesium_polylepis.1
MFPREHVEDFDQSRPRAVGFDPRGSLSDRPLCRPTSVGFAGAPRPTVYHVDLLYGHGADSTGVATFRTENISLNTHLSLPPRLNPSGLERFSGERLARLS